MFLMTRPPFKIEITEGIVPNIIPFFQTTVRSNGSIRDDRSNSQNHADELKWTLRSRAFRALPSTKQNRKIREAKRSRRRELMCWDESAQRMTWEMKKGRGS